MTVMAFWAALHYNSHPPRRAYPGDAGFDLTAIEDTVVPAYGHADIHSGVAIEWPTGVWGLLLGRSSTFRTRGLMCNPTVIDGGYRGALWANVRNLTDEDVLVRAGERIAQIVPLPLLAEGMEMHKVDALSPSERGHNGVGSSGR